MDFSLAQALRSSRRSIVAAVLALAVPAALAADLGGMELRVGMNATYPPFGTVDDAGNIVGFDVDLVNELCERINCVAVIERVQPDAIIASLDSGTFDFVASAITITPERAENILFSDPYFRVDQAIVVRVEDEDLTLDSFTGAGSELRLGAQLSTTNAETGEDLVGRERMYIYDEFNGAMQALVHGDVDGVIIDEVSALHFVGQLAGEVVIAVRGVETDEQLGLALRQGNGLVDALNEGLAELAADGTLERLTLEWFGRD